MNLIRKKTKIEKKIWLMCEYDLAACTNNIVRLKINNKHYAKKHSFFSCGLRLPNVLLLCNKRFKYVSVLTRGPHKLVLSIQTGRNNPKDGETCQSFKPYRLHLSNKMIKTNLLIWKLIYHKCTQAAPTVTSKAFTDFQWAEGLPAKVIKPSLIWYDMIY